MPIPSIVSLIISLIIASSFKDPGLLSTSGVQREEVVRNGEGEILIRSPSLTIGVWFPRPILSRRVWSWGKMVRLLTPSGDCLHSGNEGFLQVVPIGTVGGGTLLRCEREVVFEGGRNETTCVMHGCALGREIGENLIEYLESL